MSRDVDLVVSGGTVVNARWSRRADVVIDQGRVLAIAEPGTADHYRARRYVDATDRLVLPGGVDPHCHVGFTMGDFTTLDDYASATRAAVHGGTTTIVDFAIPRPGEDFADVAYRQRAKAGTGVCDSALHACVTEWDERTGDKLTALVADGIVTVKMFTTYRGSTMATSDTIMRVMAKLRDLGGMTYVHCEANHLIEHAQTEQAAAAAVSAREHHHTRPMIAEDAAVADVLAMAESLKAPVYFVHQSTPAAVELVREARSRGVAAFSEVVAHHLVLDDRVYGGEHPERFVCCPPLRPAPTVERLVKTVLSGGVDALGSDHCCYDSAQKMSVSHDVRAMPNGLPGVETRLPVLFETLVVGQGLPVDRFVALTSTNPARLNGLYPRKGALLPGSDADIAIWNTADSRTLEARSLRMSTDYTPYEGAVVSAWPETVIVRGVPVIEENVFRPDPPAGQFVPGGAINGALQLTA